MPEIIDSPADWRGSDLRERTDWIHRLQAEEIAEIDAALRSAKEKDRTPRTLTQADFPLSRMLSQITDCRSVLEEGAGLYLFRGFPVEKYSKDELRLIYWGLGLHIGTAVSQSSGGDILGDVKNFNTALHNPRWRGYTSNQKLNYHTDFCDVVGLFVLQTAKRGGLSILGSTVTIHNEIARRRPDLLEVLYQPFPYSWQGQQPENSSPHYMLPVFTVHKGRFACIYVRSHIESSQRFDDAPRLSPAQKEAMDLMDEIAANPNFNFMTMFEPGDLQLVNNHVLFHSRTAFEDHEEPERCRHLLRLWLATPNSRELSPSFAPIYGEGRAGAVRGGFPSLSGEYVYETTESVL